MRRPRWLQGHVGEAAARLEKNKRTTITSERHEFFIVRRQVEHSIRMWCAACAAEVFMLEPEEAAAIINVSTRTIYRWIEAGQTHHAETGAGKTVVCINGLFGSIDSR